MAFLISTVLASTGGTGNYILKVYPEDIPNTGYRQVEKKPVRESKITLHVMNSVRVLCK